MGADADEGMDTRETADGRVIPHGDVTGEAREIDDDDMVADDAVVGDVARGHDQAMAPHEGVVALASGPMDGDVLADRGIVADGHPHGKAVAVLEVLRHPPDDRAVVDAAARADGHSPLEDDVGADLAVRADPDGAPDDRVWADGRSRPDLGPALHDGRGVDPRRLGHRARPPSSRTCFSRDRTRLRSSGSMASATQIRRVWLAGRAG